MPTRLTQWMIRAALAAALFLLPIVVAGIARADDGDPVAAASRMMQAGDAATAARLLAARVAARPDDLTAQTWLTVTLDRLVADGDTAALEGVRQVLPDWPPVIERLAHLYDNAGRHADAAALYQSWIVLRPGNPEPYARLAEHEAARGNLKKAVALFERHRVLVGGESDYAARRVAAVREKMHAAPEWAPPAGPGHTVARAR